MEENLRGNTAGLKKSKIYAGMKIFVFFAVLFLCILVSSKVVKRKDSVEKYADFVKNADQVDVLFFGSSHVLDAINPLQLYAEYGITGYNMAKSGGMVTESYWMLMNALEYCEPKCVVVDLWALDREYQYIDAKDGEQNSEEAKQAVSFLHDNFDFLPFNKTKVAAVNDLISDKETKKGFYWDFILYHNRWSSLEARDFKVAMGIVEKPGYLGSTPAYLVEKDLHIYQSDKVEDVLPEDTVCVQYLYKILDECEKRGIEVVLAFFPMSQSYEQDWMAVNTGQKIADERNLTFINLLPHDTQNVIDMETDMFDGIHANVNGMRKITSYVGKYLCKVEGIEDHRQDPAYQAWGELVSRWQGEEIDRLLNEGDMYIELGMIQNLNANSIIFMRGNSPALQDVMVQKFIMQLSGTTAILDAAASGGPYLLIRDATGGTMQIQEYIGEQQIESFPTILGDTHYIAMKPFSAIYVDGNMEYNYLDMEEHYDSSMQITILGQAGEIMSRLYYEPNWNDMKKGNIE